jgi:hypothetical protein
MTTTERGAGAIFEVDWEALHQALFGALPGIQHNEVRSVIAEYQRQQQAAGYVTVRANEIVRSKRTIEGILKHRSRFSAEQIADLNLVWRVLDRLAADGEA